MSRHTRRGDQFLGSLFAPGEFDQVLKLFGRDSLQFNAGADEIFAALPNFLINIRRLSNKRRDVWLVESKAGVCVVLLDADKWLVRDPKSHQMEGTSLFCFRERK